MNEPSESTAGQGQRCVLFVDDDAAFLKVITEWLEHISAGHWRVVTADSVARALETLKSQAVDLAVIDVRMPVMDGLQMLTVLNRSHPTLQKVLLTGVADESQRAAWTRAGAELVLVKPDQREGWEGLYVVLNELIRHQPEEGFRGVLRRVGLTDVIQMECLARKSSVLDITNGRAQGQIFFEEGQIIHAQLDELSGEAAFNRLLSMTGGQFAHKPFAEPPTRTISAPWEFLLMEAARKADEASQGDTEVVTAAKSSATAAEVPPAATSPQPLSGLLETDLFTRKSPAPATPAQPTAPKVEEVLICSERGEVLQEWQCRNVRGWIGFFELLARKAHDIERAAATGEFDRLEISSGDARAVVILGADRRVLIRTRQEGRPNSLPDALGDSQSHRTVSNDQIKEWLRAAPKLAGTLVRGIRFADGTCVFDSHSSEFEMPKLQQAWSAVNDTFQAMLALFPSANRLVWVYAQAVLHVARRVDGTTLGVLVGKESEAADAASLSRLLAEFRRLPVAA